jgi:hypothetical protein
MFAKLRNLPTKTLFAKKETVQLTEKFTVFPGPNYKQIYRRKIHTFQIFYANNFVNYPEKVFLRIGSIMCL